MVGASNKSFQTAMLFGSIAVVIIHHLYFFYGYFGFDDMHYCLLSSRLLEGEIDFSDHYSFRWTILGFTSLAYYLFGISDFSTTLPALLLSIGMLVMIYRDSRDLPPYTLAIIYILFFAVKWNLFYTDKPMPDIYVSFFTLGAWLSYKNRDQQVSRNSLLFVVVLFGAFLSKGTVLLFAPLLAVYFISDIVRKKYKFWSHSILYGGGLLAIYLGVVYQLTGSALYRFTAIKNNEYFNSCSYYLLPFEETWSRITTGFAQFIYAESLSIFLGIALLPFLVVLVRRQQLPKEITFYVSTIIVLFLSMNFMSISFSGYNPMCLDPRHYLFCVPICAIATGRIIHHYTQGLDWRGQWLAVLVTLLLFIPNVKFFQYCRSLQYPQNRADLQTLATIAEEQNKTIVSNQVMVNLLRYYSGFTRNDRFLPHREREQLPQTDDYWVAHSWYTSFHSGTSVESIRDSLALAPEALVKDEEISRPFTHIEVFRPE